MYCTGTGLKLLILPLSAYSPTSIAQVLIRSVFFSSIYFSEDCRKETKEKNDDECINITYKQCFNSAKSFINTCLPTTHIAGISTTKCSCDSDLCNSAIKATSNIIFMPFFMIIMPYFFI